MTPLNSKNSLDESTGSIKVTHNNAMNANEQSTKTPWFLSFAPGAILRQIGLIAVLAVVTLILLNDVRTADSSTFPKGIHCYEKFDGKKSLCQPPMDGKITATPTIKAATNASRAKSTVNGYVDSTYPDLNNKRERLDPGYMWTEYFKIHWTEIVKNPNYDPDDDDSGAPKYWNGVYVDTGEQGFHEHGDEYMNAGEMQRRHGGAKQGKKTDGDGIEQVVWAKTGEWIFTGESERVRGIHNVLSEIADAPDMRLARHQSYFVGVYWKLDHLTYNGREFEVKKKDFEWRDWFKKFNAFASSRKKINIVEQNTEVNEGPDIAGSSQLFWVSQKKTTAVGSPPVYATILWTPDQTTTSAGMYGRAPSNFGN